MLPLWCSIIHFLSTNNWGSTRHGKHGLRHKENTILSVFLLGCSSLMMIILLLVLQP